MQPALASNRHRKLTKARVEMSDFRDNSIKRLRANKSNAFGQAKHLLEVHAKYVFDRTFELPQCGPESRLKNKQRELRWKSIGARGMTEPCSRLKSCGDRAVWKEFTLLDWIIIRSLGLRAGHSRWPVSLEQVSKKTPRDGFS